MPSSARYRRTLDWNALYPRRGPPGIRDLGIIGLQCTITSGLRRMVLDATPLPVLPEPLAAGAAGPARTKKAVLLALYRAHPHYGNRRTASRIAAELASQAGLQAGTARSYLYAELDSRPS